MRSPVLSTLDVEFKSVFEGMTLPSNSGMIRPRSRTRRNFSVVSKDNNNSNNKTPEEKDETTTTTTTTTANNSSSEDEEGKKKTTVVILETAKKRAPICTGEEDLKDDDKDAAAAAAAAKDTEPRSDNDVKVNDSSPKKKYPLVKMKTHDAATMQASLASGRRMTAPSTKKHHRSEPSAYIDVTTDSLDRHRPGHLPGPAAYVDIDGIDPIQPAYVGMTVEQWRAFKRSNAVEENDFGGGMDDHGLGGGGVGNLADGGDW